MSERLRSIVRQARLDVLKLSLRAQVGHVPSALSMVDYLAVLFDRLDLGHDRVVLGKPFGAQAYYALLAAYGWIERRWDLYGQPLPDWTYIIDRTHPRIRYVDDSMGNGLAVACGIAKGTCARVWINSSDASLQAGSMWEAIQYAGAHHLANVLLSIDHNDMQASGRVSDICAIEPIDDKLTDFGWRCMRCNGHDLEAIAASVDEALRPGERPTALVFDTTKGRGVPFMEHDFSWHYRKLDDNTYADAVRSLA
jgi:transketolase